MPYLIRDGRAVCTRCGRDVENRGAVKADHQATCSATPKRGKESA